MKRAVTGFALYLNSVLEKVPEAEGGNEAVISVVSASMITPAFLGIPKHPFCRGGFIACRDVSLFFFVPVYHCTPPTC